MKTTRAKLFEKLIEIQKEYGASMGLSSPWIELKHFGDKLIESGLVEVEEEPKEFWVFEDSEGTMYMSLSEDLIKYNPNKTPKNPMVKKGKFHSVDQCKKYEKMWDQIKDDFRQFSSVTNRMEELEKGEK